jgi:hypothetical protein
MGVNRLMCRVEDEDELISLTLWRLLLLLLLLLLLV